MTGIQKLKRMYSFNNELDLSITHSQRWLLNVSWNSSRMNRQGLFIAKLKINKINKTDN